MAQCFNIKYEKSPEDVRPIIKIDEIKDNVLVLDSKIVITKNAAMYQNFYIYNNSIIKKFYLNNEKMLLDYISYIIFQNRELEFPKEEYSFKEIMSTVKEDASIESFLNNMKYKFSKNYRVFILKHDKTFIVISLDGTEIKYGCSPTCISSIKDINKKNICKPLEPNKDGKYLLPFIDYNFIKKNSTKESRVFISLDEIRSGPRHVSDSVSIANYMNNNILDFGEEDDYSGEDLDNGEITDTINIESNIKDNCAIKFFTGVYYYKYTVKNDEEEEFLDTYLNSTSIPSFLQCLWIAKKYKNSNKKMYKHYSIKTTSKVREIYAPEDDVKKALKGLLAPLNASFDLKNNITNSNQSAFIKDTSIKNNALIHAKNKYIVKCDIKGFYDSCNWDIIYPHLKYYITSIKECNINEYDNNVKLIKNMIINPITNGLYTGSPLSGVLSNLAIRSASIHLKNIFANKKMEFSIYADDITVSSNEPIKPSYVTGTIKYVFESHKLPFKLKPEKTKLGKNNGRRITGIRINHLDQLTIDRKKYYMLKVYLHRLSKGLEIDIPITKLQGYLSFAKFIDQSGKIDKLLNKYENIIKNNNIQVDLDLIDDSSKELFNDDL